MVETAAHLADHVLPRLPVRQWVLSVLERLRCGGEMRIIAFITKAVAVRDILAHLGEATSPPRAQRQRSSPEAHWISYPSRDAPYSQYSLATQEIVT